MTPAPALLHRIGEAPQPETSAVVAEKIPKQMVAYVNTDPYGEYVCGDCMMFIPDKNRCTIHPKDQEIKEHGSCVYWIKGKPATGEEPHGGVTQEISGYEDGDGDGFSCKRCAHFHAEVKDCEKVDAMSEGVDPGTIEGNSCCNLFSLKRGNPNEKPVL